jgi:hypothetical protein
VTDAEKVLWTAEIRINKIIFVQVVSWICGKSLTDSGIVWRINMTDTEKEHTDDGTAPREHNGIRRNQYE